MVLFQERVYGNVSDDIKEYLKYAAFPSVGREEGEVKVFPVANSGLIGISIIGKEIAKDPWGRDIPIAKVILFQLDEIRHKVDIYDMIKKVRQLPATVSTIKNWKNFEYESWYEKIRVLLNKYEPNIVGKILARVYLGDREVFKLGYEDSLLFLNAFFHLLPSSALQNYSFLVCADKGEYQEKFTFSESIGDDPFLLSDGKETVFFTELLKLIDIVDENKRKQLIDWAVDCGDLPKWAKDGLDILEKLERISDYGKKGKSVLCILEMGIDDVLHNLSVIGESKDARELYMILRSTKIPLLPPKSLPCVNYDEISSSSELVDLYGSAISDIMEKGRELIERSRKINQELVNLRQDISLLPERKTLEKESKKKEKLLGEINKITSILLQELSSLQITLQYGKMYIKNKQLIDQCDMWTRKAYMFFSKGHILSPYEEGDVIGEIVERMKEYAKRLKSQISDKNSELKRYRKLICNAEKKMKKIDEKINMLRFQIREMEKDLPSHSSYQTQFDHLSQGNAPFYRQHYWTHYQHYWTDQPNKEEKEIEKLRKEINKKKNELAKLESEYREQEKILSNKKRVEELEKELATLNHEYEIVKEIQERMENIEKNYIHYRKLLKEFHKLKDYNSFRENIFSFAKRITNIRERLHGIKMDIELCIREYENIINNIENEKRTNYEIYMRMRGLVNFRKLLFNCKGGRLQ